MQMADPEESFDAPEPRRSWPEGHVPSVMIVDDDPGIVNALSRRCQKLGVKVTTAHNGLQAILKAKQNFPDLLILDLNMPELDGFRVCEWVLSPDRPPMDIIVLTGNQDPETYDRCDALGAYLVPKSSEAWSRVSSILCEVFDLTLPGDANDEAKLPSKKDVPLPVTGVRVLLVDDDPDIVRFMEARLRKLGVTVFVAYDGLEAYRLAVREQPHIVVADYLMPQGGGHYLIWRLRDNPTTANTPIFIVSGEIETRDRPLPRKADLIGPRGANRVFRKPVPYEELLEAMKEECPMLRAATAGAA